MFNRQKSENRIFLRLPAVAAFFCSWLAPWTRLLVPIGRNRSLRLIRMLLIVPVLWILLVSLLTRSLVWRRLLRRRLLALTAPFSLPLYVLGKSHIPLCRRKLRRLAFACISCCCCWLATAGRVEYTLGSLYPWGKWCWSWVNSREGSTSVFIEGVPYGVKGALLSDRGIPRWRRVPANNNIKHKVTAR